MTLSCSSDAVLSHNYRRPRPPLKLFPDINNLWRLLPPTCTFNSINNGGNNPVPLSLFTIIGIPLTKPMLKLFKGPSRNESTFPRQITRGRLINLIRFLVRSRNNLYEMYIYISRRSDTYMYAYMHTYICIYTYAYVNIKSGTIKSSLHVRLVHQKHQGDFSLKK